MSDIYCEDFLNPNYNKINEAFEKMSISDILNHLKLEVGNYEKKYAFNTDIEESCATDGINELISDLKHAPEVGCQLQGEIFNTITRGGRKGKMYLRSAGSGIGKAAPNYTKIPTPNGWTTIGKIKVGDYLFDRLGKPTKVLAVYPQKEKKQIYKVYFKSGRVAECCNEHLWSYYSNLNDRNPNKLFTSTLQEIIDNPLGLKDSKGAYRWSIPICEPVQYSHKKYDIDPYVMGLILGDDSFKNVQGEDILKNYPELWNKKSEDKFVPRKYLFGSVEQRFDLLAGLLDTDGSIDNKGRIKFTTISSKLRDNVVELCESLGMVCSITVDKRNKKYTTEQCYNINIKTSKENKLKMFKLTKKLEKAKKYFNNNKRQERRDRDSIIKIEATNKYADMTCFYVDNDEHLFLMNNYICTHNTRNMVGDACNIAYPIRFDTKKNEWVETGSNEKVLYIMTEQDPSEIQTMILAYLTGYNEDMFLCGSYGERELIRIKQAVSIMEKYKDNMLFARLPDPSSAVVKNLFRRYNIQYGVENFFYDYIFSSPAMLNEYRDLKVQEHVCLRLFTTTLKNLAIELDSFVMTSTQVSSNGENKKEGGFKDYHNVQGSRAIPNLVDFACVMSAPTLDELSYFPNARSQFGYIPNLVTDVYKNRRGRWNNIRIWSYVNLGTCRKIDLFVTTPDNKPITEFQLIDFSQIQKKHYQELCNNYNQEILENSDTEIIEDKVKVSEVKPEDLIVDTSVFNDKSRFKNVSFADLI